MEETLAFRSAPAASTPTLPRRHANLTDFSPWNPVVIGSISVLDEIHTNYNRAHVVKIVESIIGAEDRCTGIGWPSWWPVHSAWARSVRRGGQRFSAWSQPNTCGATIATSTGPPVWNLLPGRRFGPRSEGGPPAGRDQPGRDRQRDACGGRTGRR